MTTNPELPSIKELRRLAAPVDTPQALAWQDGVLWISSRDESRLVSVEPTGWEVRSETTTPGILWAAVAVGQSLYFTSGEGEADDRYLRRFSPETGWDDAYRVAVPELTGSYLSATGEHLYLSQWYKHRVLQLDSQGAVQRTINVGAEICGHTFVGRDLFVLCGTEKDGESWHLARLDPTRPEPEVHPLAKVPFPCRSLTFDGTCFWTNHRAGNETVCFAHPGV